MTTDSAWEQRDPRVDAALPALAKLVVAVRRPEHAIATAETDAALEAALVALGGKRGDHERPGWRYLAVVLAAMVPAGVPISELLGWTEDRERYLRLMGTGMPSCQASAAALRAVQDADRARVEEQRRADWQRRQPVIGTAHAELIELIHGASTKEE